MIGKIIGAVGLLGATTATAIMISPAATNKEFDWTAKVVQNDTIEYPSLEDAAIISNFDADSIKQAIISGEPIDGHTFKFQH